MAEIRANLVHLGSCMWADPPGRLVCEDAEWQAITERMAAKDYNMILVDLGEGVRYESHPEIASEGAWSVGKLRGELARLRGLGLEPIPKMNFSTAHDIWLGEYHRMVSTPEYYRVCGDLIREAAAIFDKPRFFHIGYDEEDAWNHVGHAYVALRQGELWWHDLDWFVQTVEKAGMRAWMWSDHIWEHRDEFLKRMPRSVVQSNWYYDDAFNSRAFRWPRVMNYIDLDKAGFDQIPTCSNCVSDVNAVGTVDFCRKNLLRDRLLGFLQSSWRLTTAANRKKNFDAIDQLAVAAAYGS